MKHMRAFVNVYNVDLDAPNMALVAKHAYNNRPSFWTPSLQVIVQKYKKINAPKITSTLL
jgi:hypothetical protein